MAGSEEATGSDGAIEGATIVASAGLRISLCGARLWEDVAAPSKLFETDRLPVLICPCVCEELDSCASAADTNGFDWGATKQIPNDTGTTAAMMVKHLLNW